MRLSSSLVMICLAGPAWAQFEFPVVEARLQQQLGENNLEPFNGMTFSMDMTATTVVAGAPEAGTPDTNQPGPGSAYVFELTGTTWVQQAQLNASDMFDGHRFGDSVAIDGDVIVVGASDADALPVMGTGAAYVFTRTGTTWGETAKLTAGNFDADPNDEFGDAVDIDGDTIVVGASDDETNGLDTGSAYAFEFDGTQWTETFEFVPSSPCADRFGTRVALDGDTVAISSPTDQFGGTVYIFERTGSTWNETAQLRAGDIVNGDSFGGGGLDLEGDTLVVPARFKDIGSGQQGSAYVFERTGTVWAETAKLTANDHRTMDRFGNDPSIDGDRIIIGAARDDLVTGGGVAFLFRRDALGWGLASKIMPTNPFPTERFGTTVEIVGDRVVVGAPRHDLGNVVLTGYLHSYQLFDTEFDAFCPGQGGDGLGCTACPCGNEARQSSRGGCGNTMFWSCTLVPGGSSSATAGDLMFDINGANPSTFALLAAGLNRLPANPANPCPAGSGIFSMLLDGLRCVGGDVRRLGTRATNPDGANVQPWGNTLSLVDQLGMTVGQSRHFQVFYREPMFSPCGTFQNTSNGITVTATP